MANPPPNTIWIALGAGVGVLLVSLLLGTGLAAGVLRAVVATLITAGLVLLFERGARS
jgi:hypothetical protein